MGLSVKVYYNNQLIEKMNVHWRHNKKYVDEKKLLTTIRKNFFVQKNLGEFNFDQPDQKFMQPQNQYGYLRSGPWSLLWKQVARQAPRNYSGWWFLFRCNPLLLPNSLLFVLTLCASLELLHRILMKFI